MRAQVSAPRKRQIAALAVVLAGGCGGKVIFEGGAGGSTSSGTGNGAVTSTGSGTECVIGVCGDQCTKCVNGTCFTGKCDASLKCQPPGTTPVCTK